MSDPSSKPRPGAKLKGRAMARARTDLTPKREAFAQNYVETGNASEAYRRAFSVRAGTTAKSINEGASKVLADSKVSARVAELQVAHLERHKITIDDLLDELDEAREVARKCETPQSSAMIAATLGKAKLLGLLVDKVDARVLTASLPVSVDDLV